MSKFKVGDKVKLRKTSKYYRSSGEQLNDHTGVVGSLSSGGWIRISWTNGSNAYKEADLQLITKGEEKVKTGRRTFKQIKDSYNLKKGALWQEQCDDGTQPYVVLNAAEVRIADVTKDRREFEVRDRSVIEDSPSWFVEVFAVEPQYMTQEELDKWEAFKGTKLKRKYTKRHKVTRPGRVAVQEAPAYRKAGRPKKFNRSQFMKDRWANGEMKR